MAMFLSIVLCSLALAQCGALHDLCSKVPEVAGRTVANQGKFAVWDASLEALLYVDSPACLPAWKGSIVYAFRPSDGSTHEVITFAEATVGSIMPRREAGGVLLAITDSGTSTIRTMEINRETLKGSNMQVVATLPADTEGKFNNGNCDPEGRYWAGTFNYQHEESSPGKLWVLQPDEDGHGYRAEVGLDNIGHPNGMFWRKNGTEVLVPRSYLNEIERYAYSADGRIVSKPSVLARNPASGSASDDPHAKLFDSMCGFEDGSFLVTGPHYGVLRYFDAGGDHLCDIQVPNIAPSTFVASCAFVGDDLYIPTGSNNCDGERGGPAGWLYRIRGVAGGVQASTCDVHAPSTLVVV
jgi:sugar lactone lactonase YvrE